MQAFLGTLDLLHFPWMFMNGLHVHLLHFPWMLMNWLHLLQFPWMFMNWLHLLHFQWMLMNWLHLLQIPWMLMNWLHLLQFPWMLMNWLHLLHFHESSWIIIDYTKPSLQFSGRVPDLSLLWNEAFSRSSLLGWIHWKRKYDLNKLILYVS